MPGSKIPDGTSNQLSRDERFLQSLNRIIESNLSNDQFGVEQLAESLNISRTQLFRRLQKLTGKNISQYLRESRLKKALELLKKDVASASEIAYQVGFSSPSYFNKCFHDHYGISPGLVNKSKENVESEETPSESHKQQNHIGYSEQKRSIWNNRKFVYLLFIIGGILIVSIAIGYYIKLNEKSPSATLTPINTIAVLPFKNDSPDESNEHLCNGIMEDILTHLEYVSDLSVKSRQSVEKYRDKPTDPRVVGKELNVSYLLEGSFRRVADSIRVIVQLIDAKTGDQIWADTYDGTFSNKIFEFQSNVARHVAISMNAIITPEEKKQIDRQPTKNIKAYALVKSGFELMRAYWRDMDTLHIYQAISLFEKALELDPNLIAAMEGKATTLRNANMYFGINYPKNWLDTCMFYYKKALEIDPQKFQIYRAIGETYQSIGNHELALKNLNRAIYLKPDDAWTHLIIGIVYLEQREYENAFEFFFKSVSLNKEAPEIWNKMGSYFPAIGCYGLAEEYLKKAVDIQSGCNTLRYYIYSLYMAGKFEEGLHFVDSIKNYINCKDLFNRYLFQFHVALKNFDKAKKYMPDIDPFDVEGIILNAFLDKKMGKIDFAKEFYERENDFILTYTFHGGQPSFIPFALAQINAIKGNNKAAVKYLLEYEKQFLLDREEFRRYAVIHAYIETHPIFEELHGDPDFEAFIERASNMRREIEEIAIEAEERFLF